MVLKFACELHEYFLLWDDIGECLDYLLYFIVEFWLRADVVEALD